MIALAAIFQSASLVHEVAHRGRFDSQAAEPIINALFQFEAPSTEKVYGCLENLEPGLRVLEKQLNHPDKNQMEIPQMVMNMIVLSNKLVKANARMTQIRDSLGNVETKLDHYDLTHINILSALADIYRQQVSDLSPRIMVKGNELHLQNTDNQHRIRSLLLAGLRSAVLWNQLGGSRFAILFQRKKQLSTVHDLMNLID